MLLCVFNCIMRKCVCVYFCLKKLNESNGSSLLSVKLSLNDDDDD
jgi:hypothetical protein